MKRRSITPLVTGFEPLARDGPVAMHRQIAAYLRDCIAQGIYKSGQRIPGELELIQKFGVSRITVRQAIEALALEELVVRKQGKGTFVALPTVRHDLHELRGIYDELVAQGHAPETRLLQYGLSQPPARIAQRLGTGQRKLPHWWRLYEVRGTAFAVSKVYLNAGRTHFSREDIERNPTYQIVEKLMGERIGKADVSIRYIGANAELAGILKLRPHSPLLAFERVSHSVEGVPREHSLYYAPAEAYEFSLTIRGKLAFSPMLKSVR